MRTLRERGLYSARTFSGFDCIFIRLPSSLFQFLEKNEYSQNHCFIRIFPLLLIFKERIFVCWQKTNEDISAKQVCKGFIWVTNLGTIHCVLCRQTIKIEAFSMVTSLQTTQHKNNQNEPKNHANQLISDQFCSLPVSWVNTPMKIAEIAYTNQSGD